VIFLLEAKGEYIFEGAIETRRRAQPTKSKKKNDLFGYDTAIGGLCP